MLSFKRLICSMVMGAGKTLTSIAALKELATENVLIVCPKTIIRQWIPEIYKVLGVKAIPLTNKNIDKFVESEFIGICTYQTLARNINKLAKKKHTVIIADEIQFIRNNESKTWSCFKKLQTDFFYGLSGTVIENKLDDLYNIMDVLCPNLLGPKWKFDSRFKKIKSIHLTNVIYENKTQNIQELRKLIANHVFSYDVIPFSDSVVKPKPKYNNIHVKLDPKAQEIHDYYIGEANRLISQSLNGVISLKERLLIQAYYLKARQACNCISLLKKEQQPAHTEKIEHVYNIIKDVCINKNEKLVIFSEWTSMLDIVEKFIRKMNIKTCRLDGTKTLNQRSKAIKDFQDVEENKVFLSSDAGNLGVDGLQLVCNNILHIELPWNPAKLDQRNGRLYRMLQKKDVNIYNLIAKDTIEHRIFDNLQDKKKIRIETLF